MRVREDIQLCASAKHVLACQVAFCGALDAAACFGHSLREKIESRGDAEALGERLARVLIDAGAGKILEALNEHKNRS